MCIAPARSPRRIIPIPPFPPFGIESTHRSSQKIQLPAQYVSVFLCTTLRISTAASVRSDGAHMRKSKDPNSIFPYWRTCANSHLRVMMRNAVTTLLLFFLETMFLFSLCTARKDTTYNTYKFLLYRRSFVPPSMSLRSAAQCMSSSSSFIFLCAMRL